MNCKTDADRIARGRSRAAATSKMERLVIIVNTFQPLTIITKHSVLDDAVALDPPLIAYIKQHTCCVNLIRKDKKRQ